MAHQHINLKEKVTGHKISAEGHTDHFFLWLGCDAPQLYPLEQTVLSVLC
jgi:hypothetical protein